MPKTKMLLILGVWLAVLPYLGFPLYFKGILVSVTGLFVFYIGYMLHGETREGNKKREVFENFSENTGFTESNSISDKVQEVKNRI